MPASSCSGNARTGGGEFPVDISLSPLDTEEGLLLAATIRDVTERTRLERIREEFIANAAHELRTPLTTLSGVGEMLALHLHELSQDQLEQSLAALKRQGERASVLVSNLLDLSQVEGGRALLDIQDLNVASAAKNAVEVAPAPEGTSVEISVDDGTSVHADPVRFQQILTNLLTNAYRYGGRNVTIDARSEPAGVIVSVSDDGSGVPPDLLPNVFEPFTRGRTAGAVGGSGIGLALCRRLVEVFGGSMWYETAQPHGARFVVRLPRPA